MITDNLYLGALSDRYSGEMQRNTSINNFGTMAAQDGQVILATASFSNMDLIAGGSGLRADTGTITETGNIEVLNGTLLLEVDSTMLVNGNLFWRDRCPPSFHSP